MHENVAQPKTELSRVYFTKEFPGFEIESKWTLLTQNPVPVLLKMRSDILEGWWQNFNVAVAMGKLPVGTRFFDLTFQFWGAKQNDSLEQVAMVACLPSEDRYQLAFKSPQQQPLRLSHILRNPPLARLESRTGNWISYAKVVEEIRIVAPHAQMVGEMKRQKCFTYITSTKSYRNFSISADLCHNGYRSLSQVEVEYKGRNGCWIPDRTGDEIIQDFSEIHLILEKLYGDILIPTNQTKFKWITGD